MAESVLSKCREHSVADELHDAATVTLNQRGGQGLKLDDYGERHVFVALMRTGPPFSGMNFPRWGEASVPGGTVTLGCRQVRRNLIAGDVG